MDETLEHGPDDTDQTARTSERSPCQHTEGSPLIDAEKTIGDIHVSGPEARVGNNPRHCSRRRVQQVPSLYRDANGTVAASPAVRQRLLDDASETLSGHFYGASSQINDLLRVAAALPDLDHGAMHGAMQNLAGAITALQFHDMAIQLIAHPQKRLRSCADRIARDAMGEDDEDGSAIVEDGPGRPNPVTQDEMDAGSIELF